MKDPPINSVGLSFATPVPHRGSPAACNYGWGCLFILSPAGRRLSYRVHPPHTQYTTQGDSSPELEVTSPGGVCYTCLRWGWDPYDSASCLRVCRLSVGCVTLYLGMLYSSSGGPSFSAGWMVPVAPYTSCLFRPLGTSHRWGPSPVGLVCGA